MFGVIFRIIWRILILVIGSALLWVTIFAVYPYADSRMPAYVVLLLLYCLFAYVVIPFLVRLSHLVVKPDHLPVYVTSGDGWSSDPVNIIVLCRDRRHLVKMMESAGWHVADPVTVRNTVRFGYAMLFNRPYPTAPFSSLYLFGRRQDIGFQIQTGDSPSPRHRHHVRFWQLTETDTIHTHANFWQKALALFTRQNREIWIGAATHDIAPFAVRIQNLQLTHKIDPDTNNEREYVIKSLADQNLVKRVEIIKTGEPLTFKGQTFGVRIIVDGLVKVVELKQS